MLKPCSLKTVYFKEISTRISVHNRTDEEFSCDSADEGSGIITAAAGVTAVAWVNPCPGNFQMLWSNQKKKKKKTDARETDSSFVTGKSQQAQAH